MRLTDVDELWKDFISADKDDIFGLEDVEEILDNAPTIEPNLVINPDEIERGDVVEIGENIVVMHHDDYYDMFIKSELYDDIEQCEDAISREALIDAHYEYLYEHSYESPEFEGWSLELMKNAPSVAPSIDIIRCKECKKAHLTYDGDCKYCDEWQDDDGNYIRVYHDGDHFCSYGERKESE